LDEEVLAGVQARHAEPAVRSCGGGERDRFDLRVGKDLLDRLRHGNGAVAPHDLPRTIADQVAHPAQLGAFGPQEIAEEIRAPVAGTRDRHADRLHADLSPDWGPPLSFTSVSSLS